MNWLQFVRLMHSIYGSGKPDIDWIQRQGLLAVKLGQVHALRIDFLDRETCEILSRLYRQTTPLPPAELERLLARNLSPEVRARFAEFEAKPLASASVGQVHRAILTTGETVAVKLVKGEFEAQLRRDVASVRRLFRLATFFYPRLRQVGDPVGILDDIETYAARELDLRHELAGHRELRELQAAWQDRHDLSALKLARIHADLSNARVLVSDYLPGRSFDELLTAGELPYERLLELFKVHGFCMFKAGVFHGDLHPGNVIAADPGFYLVDTGYIGRVKDRLRQGLLDFFRHLSVYDYQGCAQALNAMSETELTGPAFERFRKQFLELYAEFTDATVSQVSLTTQMMHTIKLGVRSGMVFEKGIFAIIRSLMYMDGMVLRCNPKAILMHDMRRFLDDLEA